MYEVETITTRHAPPAARAALWSATVTSFQGAHRFDYPLPGRFDATATRQHSARFQLVSWHIEHEQTISRRRAGDDCHRLMFPLAGVADLRLADTVHQLGTADGVLLGPGSSYDLRLPPGSRGLIATLPSTEFDHHGEQHRLLRLAHAPGRVLALMLTTLVEDRGELDGRAFDAICCQVAQLTQLVADERRALPEQDLAAQIRLVVRRHAHDPELTGAAVARHVGWSLRQVQVMLQREGTSPSALIRHTRLELARDLLTRPGTITAVARASGFHSIDAFEKAFRRHYGTSPSSYRAATPPP